MRAIQQRARLVVQIFCGWHLKIMPNALFGVFRNPRAECAVQNKQEKFILKQNVKDDVKLDGIV
jgi:hypothetical protein